MPGFLYFREEASPHLLPILFEVNSLKEQLRLRVKDLEIQKELENDNFEQWVDVNTNTTFLRIDFLSAYPGEEVNGQNSFDECAIQEIRFFGKG